MLTTTPGSLAPPWRVVIADTAFLPRSGVEHVLTQEQDEIDLVGCFTDLSSLLGAVDEHGPEVVITEVSMRPTHTDEGIQAAESLAEAHPEVGVVVLSERLTLDYALRLFANGTARRAYLLKDNVSHRIDLIRAVRAVATGSSVIDPYVVGVL